MVSGCSAWVGSLSRSILRLIGMDIHTASIPVAVAHGAPEGQVRRLGSVPNRPDHLRKLVEALASVRAQLHFCYEADPCGHGLHHQLVAMDRRRSR